MEHLSKLIPANFADPVRLEASTDAEKPGAELTWFDETGRIAARGNVSLDPEAMIFHGIVAWRLDYGGKSYIQHGGFDSSSMLAILRKWRKLLPVEDAAIQIDKNPPKKGDGWRALGSKIYQTFKPFRDPATQRSQAQFLGLFNAEPAAAVRTPLRLTLELHTRSGLIMLIWRRREGGAVEATVQVRLSGANEMAWIHKRNGATVVRRTTHALAELKAEAGYWLEEHPVSRADVTEVVVKQGAGGVDQQGTPVPANQSLANFIAEEVETMAEQLRATFKGPHGSKETPERAAIHEKFRKKHEKAEKLAAQRAAIEEKIRLRSAEKRAAEPLRPALEKAPKPAAQKPVSAPLKLPPIPVRFELPPLDLQTDPAPLTDLSGWLLREQAALWWVSNQSDDLLCLPHCRIERLEFQVRSALRVLGPLRGRALLSDEVGLGKTIEAGLVLKELFTRGMARRALIITVPSLVDQWREELSEKFGLVAATTNQPVFREDAAAFWRDQNVIVASLHTLKQPAHLAAAKEVAWDALIVDEAHHLRNRDSQSWQAVNALPRQFMLLLTATPVQNSIEELYNLVTLLKPGQLPTPREFRARFIDPKRPRQPREPEELRRLLGQVMIRNTRANAGINLPPRRAETVLFEPEPEEREFWQEWESALRRKLSELTASQSQLWGRLLLQAAGSSPAAWMAALEKFPDRKIAKSWRERAPLEASWRQKCASLVPLARGEGGCVIFTQFRATQDALKAALAAAGVLVVAVNGATPAAQRQPLTEEFQRRGGALLLTRSGAEGRNLQFCHRLVNVDLPWNPMEIEQRIGRLHRLGQLHPVRIYNLVQSGTLQEYLLGILQEKLNLFELVVGETGLILGDRFSREEFADEIFQRWRENEGQVAESFASLGDELAAARAEYGEIKRLDETLFAHDYESL